MENQDDPTSDGKNPYIATLVSSLKETNPLRQAPVPVRPKGIPQTTLAENGIITFSAFLVAAAAGYSISFLGMSQGLAMVASTCSGITIGVLFVWWGGKLFARRRFREALRIRTTADLIFMCQLRDTYLKHPGRELEWSELPHDLRKHLEYLKDTQT